ncbi:MATE family efflux transporter [Amedibacillus sp. YH-ame6]
MKDGMMLQAPVRKLYMHYLVPTLIAMLSSSMYCLADVFFISKGTGSVGLAALNIAMPLYSLFAAVGVCFGVGAATVMSIAEGNKQFDKRNKAFTLSVVCMLAIGALASILGVVFSDQIAMAFGSSKELLPYAREYMVPILASSIIFIPMYSCSVLMRADHAPSTAMKATLFGNITNIVLDYVFVIEWDMGLMGAAVATCIGAALVIVGVLPHFMKKKNTVQFTKNFLDIDLLKRMFRNGFGSGVMEISAACIVIVFNMIILYFADELFLAAFAIITNIAYVCRGLLNGFAQAAQPIMSVNYGARYFSRVKQVLRLSLVCSAIFSVITYGIFFLFAEEFAAIFASGNTRLIALGAEGIRLYFLCLVCLSAITIMMYYFQSIERGNVATVIALCKGFLFILLGFVILIPTVDLAGIWLTTPFAEALALCLGIYLFKKVGSFDEYRDSETSIS